MNNAQKTPSNKLNPHYESYLAVNVCLPLLDSIKRGDAGHIKHNDGPNRLLVVHAGHVAKALLACDMSDATTSGTGNIPQLKTHNRVGVQIDH